MVLESKVTLEVYGRTHSVLKVSNRMADDSEFPFSADDSLSLRISGDCLIVEKVPPGG